MVKEKNTDALVASPFAFIFLFAACVIAAFLISGLFYQEKILSSFEFEADVNVVDGRYSTFNLDKDKVHFGSVPKGSGARRRIIINNSYNFPVFAKISTADSIIGNWSYFNKSHKIEPNTNKMIEIGLFIPEQAQSDGYSGKYIVTIYKSKHYE